MKSVRSLKSVKSMDIDEEKIGEFDELLINACQKFNCPYSVVVNKETLRDDFYRSMKAPQATAKYKKIMMAASRTRQHVDSKSNVNFPEVVPEMSKQFIDNDTVVVTASYNNMNRLAEIALNNLKRVPRIAVQVIGLLVPFYAQLTKIAIKRCHIDKYTIYELKKMLPLSTITEVCLDGSPLPEANYAILLDRTNLRNLSLSRCMINDCVCKEIAEKLHFLGTTETTLAVLNISSNHITDLGAKHLGDALRSNRHLRYLSLADNQITDVGATHIFDVLTEFPLTCDEIYSKRHRRLEYLKTKRAMIMKYLNEYESKSVDDTISQISKKSTKKDKMKVFEKNKALNKTEKLFTEDEIIAKAEVLVGEFLGPMVDPFGVDDTITKNSFSLCKGNLSLCYLNLCYNHLTHSSLKQILKIVQYQQSIKTKPGHGLMKILVDGNDMPVSSSEMATLNLILNRNISCFGGRAFADKTVKRKSRISTVPDKIYK